MQYLVANELFGKIMHMYDEKECNASFDSLLCGTTSQVWGKSLSNELGRIAQGIGDIEDNDVVDYIKTSEGLFNCKVAYANVICEYRLLKSDPHKV